MQGAVEGLFFHLALSALGLYWAGTFISRPQGAGNSAPSDVQARGTFNIAAPWGTTQVHRHFLEIGRRFLPKLASRFHTGHRAGKLFKKKRGGWPTGTSKTREG